MSDDHGLEEARSQFEKIARLVLALQSADVFAREDAEERIHEDALEVMIRSSWHAPGRDRWMCRLNTAFCSARPAPPFELSAI